jgi:hypothetical protein
LKGFTLRAAQENDTANKVYCFIVLTRIVMAKIQNSSQWVNVVYKKTEEDFISLPTWHDTVMQNAAIISYKTDAKQKCH